MAEQSFRKEDRPETPQVSTRRVLWVALSICSCVALSIAGGRAYYDWQVRGPVNASPSAFPSPTLQIDDAAELADFEREQKAKLQKYDWVDRPRGLIAIPVERAMGIVLARGSHAYDAVESTGTESNTRGPK
jgi:hypothetical protein